MKKIIITSTLLVLFTISYSQARFGLRTGVSFADITNLDTKMGANFHLGVLLSVKVSEAYSLRPEITYSREGAMLAKEPTTIPIGSILNYTGYLIENNSKRISIDFIDISFINKLTTKNNINFLIGPFIGIRVDDNINDDTILEGVFPRLNAGLIFGLGYDISENFAIEARFKRGFTDIIHQDGDYWFNGDLNGNDDSNHSQVLQLGITYKFDLKKAVTQN